jgi:FtsZ-interacting cell division protein ZipA
MSELQLILIGIGALIILAVLVINWWQERRFHHQVEKSFSPLQKDALLDEPTFDNEKFTISKLDDRSTDHFAIEDFPSENTRQENDTNRQGSDRYVNLQPDIAAELIMQEDESIDTTYNELIYTQLDKLTSNGKENNGSSSFEASRETHVPKENDLKAVFDEALSTSTNVNDVQTMQQEITEVTVSLPALLHNQIDLIALLYLAAEMPVNKINETLAALFDNFDKPLFIHVLDSNKEWHLLKDLLSNQEALNRQISRIACSIQLADRGGAVTRNTLNRFHLAVETLGLDIDGHVEWQDAGDALSAANSLDLFCVEVDKTLGFHLVHGESGAFTGTKLRGLAESQGLILTSDGSFKYFDSSSEGFKQVANSHLHPSFIMFNRDDHPFNPDMLRSSVVKGITFQLDIPHVKQCAEVFTHMVQVARQMEIGLNAALVDDNNKPLGDMQVEKIRQQLKKIQATMLARGVTPGSDSAHRLFS